MPLLPDLGVAGGIALAVFLVVLGFLVVFVESVGRRAVVAVVGIVLVLGVALSLLGEPGVALIAFGFAAAFVANEMFEWLTTR